MRCYIPARNHEMSRARCRNGAVPGMSGILGPIRMHRIGEVQAIGLATLELDDEAMLKACTSTIRGHRRPLQLTARL